MVSPRFVKFALAGVLFCAATPAMASDFSGLIYFFLAVIAVVGLFVIAGVYALRKIVATAGLVIDATSAGFIAAALAPAGYIHQFGETVFVWFPGWVLLVFDLGWGDLVPSYPISFAVVAGLVFGLFRLFATRRTQLDSEEVE